MLKIISVPNKVLLTSTKLVTKIDDKIKELVYDMEKTLVAQKDPIGVGLAANQVNQPLSIFIIRTSKKAKTKVFINPSIISRSDPASRVRPYKRTKKKPVKLEGCLSIPRIWGPVKRASKILLEYQNTTGAVIRGWFQGFEATVIQHEMDHLKGIVFTQRSMEQGQKIYKEINGELKEIEV